MGRKSKKKIVISISIHAYFLAYKNLQESCKRTSSILVSKIPNGFTLATSLLN